ncbi:MAG: transposase [Puniceicoccaceae bacterium]|nr:MAG: transposase [Puniceicoccaceae bacterium]
MRTRRVKVLGQSACYHVISRTAGGLHLFGPTEKEVFRKIIRKVARFCGVEVLTFCIMSNHVHLLLKVPPPSPVTDENLIERTKRLYGATRAQEIKAVLRGPDAAEAARLRSSLTRRLFDLSVCVKEIKQRFSIWYNRTHNRYGTLWADRYKSVLVEGRRNSLQTVAAYIDLNPIRAGMANDPKDYRYCGYGEACGGVRSAREGLGTIMESRDWRTTASEYRLMLYGKGSGPAALGTGGVLPAEEARRVMAKGGCLPLPSALRCRVRYFSDGMVLGSRSFVENFFQTRRDLFSKARRSGARPMRGSEWGDLSVARDLRRETLIPPQPAPP